MVSPFVSISVWHREQRLLRSDEDFASLEAANASFPSIITHVNATINQDLSDLTDDKMCELDDMTSTFRCDTVSFSRRIF